MEQLFDSDQVFAVMHGVNPWWRGHRGGAPGFRRQAYQTCRRFLDHPTLKRAVLLSGPRRVGKSTLLLQVADALFDEGRDPRSICYLGLDHALMKRTTLPDLLKLYHERIYPEGQPAVLLLDEVQYSQDWEVYIKHLVDFKPFYRILATGSASVVHRQRLAESGVGRWVRVPMLPLSFYEFVRLRGEAPDGAQPEPDVLDLFGAEDVALLGVGARLRPLMPAFHRYLLLGGFPETARSDDLTLSQNLLREDVVERVLRRDVVSLFGVRRVDDLERLFLYLCLNTGALLSIRQCASALEVSALTVSNYLEVLEQAHLIHKLPSASLGGKKTLKAPYKVYLVDPGLRGAALVRGEEALRDPTELGIVVETAVVRHLLGFRYWEIPRLSYWRDSATGKEVDVVVRGPNRVVPVEVKYRATAPLGPDEGIVHFCRNERVSHAFWVTQREADLGVVQFPGLETKFLRIPAHIFCYLLGQAEQPTESA